MTDTNDGSDENAYGMSEMQQAAMTDRDVLRRDDRGAHSAPSANRATVDIGRLDALVQEELGAYCSSNGFSLAVWRDRSETDGCNWNARLEPLPKCAAVDNTWWDVIPRLREQYNLTPLRPADEACKLPKIGR